MNNEQIQKSIVLLEMAGLIYRVSHTSSNGIPLGAEINPKKTKILLFDTGIFQRILRLPIGELWIDSDINIVNKGNLAELFVGLELIKSQSMYEKAELFYWHREAKNSQAEVDYVCQIGSDIVPIEVKAGTKGAMQSLYKFVEEKKPTYAIRASMENYGAIDNVRIIPIYGIFGIQNKV
jgi:uncharacterized protein